MAAKFSMANTSGLFGAEAHAEASDRMQQAMEDLRIKNEKKQQLLESHRVQQEQQHAQELARERRQRQHAQTAVQKKDFIKSQQEEDEEEEDDKKSQPNQEEDDDDDDDFEDDGFEDPELLRLREARLKQLKQQYAETQALKAKGHGEYQEIAQDEFLQQVTSSHWVLVHFYHRDFERCKVMDMHLQRLAPRHIECKFLKIDAEKAPFFVEKLCIRVLPTVVCFADGIACPDRLVGFEGLAAEDEEEQEQAFGSRAAYHQHAKEQADSFSTSALARRLVSIGVLNHCDQDDEADHPQ